MGVYPKDMYYGYFEGPGLQGPLQVLPVLTDNDLFHGHRVLAELSEESPG
jgi:hypothetical protein